MNSLINKLRRLDILVEERLTSFFHETNASSITENFEEKVYPQH